MISCKNECVFICEWSELTMQMLLDAWFASMNLSSKRPIASNNSTHAVHGDLSCTAELWKPAALESYVLLVI